MCVYADRGCRVSTLVLEIGAYVGLSMLTWSHAVGPQGHVTGLEFQPSFAEMAQEAFAINNIQNTELIVGDALDTYVST